MPENNTDIPPFSSTEDHVVPAKPQKLNTNSSFTSEFSTTNPDVYSSRKLMEIRMKLRQTKATRARFHKMIVKVEKDLDEEERNLEIELKAHLETVPRSSQQIQESQASPAPDMSQMKIGTKERIMNLLTNAARTIPTTSDDIPTSPSVLKAIQEKVDLDDTELEAVERKNRELNTGRACQEEKKVLLSRAARANELEEELETAKEIIANLSAAVKGKLFLAEKISSTQRILDDAEKADPRVSGNSGKKKSMKELDLCLMKASEFMMKLPENNSQMSQENAEIRRINGNLLAENFQLKERMTDMEHQIMELDKDLKSMKNTNSRLKVGGRGLEPKVALMRIKRDKFSLKVTEDVTETCHQSIQKIGDVKTRNIKRKAGKLRADKQELTPDSHGEIDSDDKIKSVPEKKRRKQELRTKFGGNWILVSDSKYFEINWTKHWDLFRGFYRCKRCPKQYRNMNDMKDHVWSEHFGERFQCPLCKDSSKRYSWQKNIVHHIHTDHSDKCNCRKCRCQ